MANRRSLSAWRKVVPHIATLIGGIVVGALAMQFLFFAGGKSQGLVKLLASVAGLGLVLVVGYLLIQTIVRRLASQVDAERISLFLGSARDYFVDAERRKQAKRQIQKDLADILTIALGLLASTRVIGVAVVLLGTMVGVATLMAAYMQVERLGAQNELLSAQNQMLDGQNDLLRQQSISGVFAARLGSLLDAVEKDRNGDGLNLSPGTTGRIAGLSRSLEPYRVAYDDGTASQWLVSPERGQLLLTLIGAGAQFASSNSPRLDFTQSDLSNATLASPVDQEFGLGTILLDGSDLRGATLRNLDLHGVSLQRALLPPAGSFENSRLIAPNHPLSGAPGRKANTADAILAASTDLSGALIPREDWLEAVSIGPERAMSFDVGRWQARLPFPDSPYYQLYEDQTTIEFWRALEEFYEAIHRGRYWNFSDFVLGQVPEEHRRRLVVAVNNLRRYPYGDMEATSRERRYLVAKVAKGFPEGLEWWVNVGVDMQFIDFRGLDLREQDLSGAILTGSRFGNVLLSNSVLSSATLPEPDAFIGASLDGVDLSNARVPSSEWLSELSGIALEGTHLGDGNEIEFDWWRWKVEEDAGGEGWILVEDTARSQALILLRTLAYKRQSGDNGSLSTSDLIEQVATLSRALGPYSSPDFHGRQLAPEKADLFEAALSAGLESRELVNAGLDMSYARLDQMDLAGLDLTGANLSNAIILTTGSFEGLHLSEANLEGASLHYELFIDAAALDGVRLDGATIDLYELGGDDPFEDVVFANGFEPSQWEVEVETTEVLDEDGFTVDLSVIGRFSRKR